MNCETARNVAPPLPLGKIHEYDNTRATADTPPDPDFVRVVLGKVEVHVVAGNFSVAMRTLQTAAHDWRERVRELNAARRRSPTEWLQRPLVDLGLPMRLHDAFELVGCVTIADCLGIVASRERPANIGPKAVGIIREAADRLGIPMPAVTRDELDRSTAPQRSPAAVRQ